MNDPRSSMTVGPRRFDPAWIALAFVPLCAWSKDATIVVLALGLILCLINNATRDEMLSRPNRLGLASVFGGAFSIWTFVSVGWSTGFAWANWWKAFAVLAMSALFFRALGRLDRNRIGDIAAAGLSAVIGLFALLAVERVTGAGVIGFLRTAETAERLYNVMSGGLAILSSLTFPAAFVIARRWSWRAAGIAVIAVYVLALSYRMDAAPVAISAGAAAGALVYLGGRAAFVGTAVAFVLIALGWGQLAQAALDFGLDVWFAQNISGNWAERLAIWADVNRSIAARPMVGFGFDAGRTLGRETGAAVSYMHPHNGMLETRLDFGLIGASLLIGWIVGGLRATLRTPIPREALAIIAATVATAAVFWLVSFGLTAEWWLAALGLMFAALTMITRLAQPVT